MKPTFSAWKLVGTVSYLAAIDALMLLLAGDWRWRAGWIFCGWFAALCTLTIGWLYRKDPALLAERYRRPGSGGQSFHDQAIVYALALGFLTWIVLMPLDGRRFGWTHWPLAIAVVGGVLLLPAAYFLFRALAENTFASPLVRIQEERQQRVIATGVYGVVRHPMYLGAVLMFVGAPLLTRAATALAVGVLLVIVLAVRIVGEEKLLVRELPGYEEYRQRVRWRLVPFVF